MRCKEHRLCDFISCLLVLLGLTIPFGIDQTSVIVVGLAFSVTPWTMFRKCTGHLFLYPPVSLCVWCCGVVLWWCLFLKSFKPLLLNRAFFLHSLVLDTKVYPGTFIWYQHISLSTILSSFMVVSAPWPPPFSAYSLLLHLLCYCCIFSCMPVWLCLCF